MKSKAKADQPYTYYLRDKNHLPVVTVAVEPDGNGGVNRGVAVCSHSDQPCRRVGRKIALTRLQSLKAGKQVHSPTVTHHAGGRLGNYRHPLGWSSPEVGLHVPPTDFERKLLRIP